MIPAPAANGWRSVPRTVWVLGCVSMLMDISSEMIHALLPVFLVSTLGASAVMVGLIEGIGESTAAVTKIFSGAISDWLGKRKLLAAIGYGLGAASKPFFAIATSPLGVLGARFADRVGKGIRGAPRDALVADITAKEIRGAAYGLRQSLDTIGAFSGPLVAIALLAFVTDDLRTIFWIALIPAVLSVIALLLGVIEPDRPASTEPASFPLSRKQLGEMTGTFWAVVGIGIVFTFARFSEAFLVLRGQDAGLALTYVPAILIAMNVVYAASALPAGAVSDGIDRRVVLIAGLIALIAADMVLAIWATVPGVLIGAALWGLHMGMTQGLFAAMIADTAPPNLRATAFGLFNLITGIALFGASLLAGALWEAVGPASTFVAGAGFAALTAVGLLVLVYHGQHK